MASACSFVAVRGVPPRYREFDGRPQVAIGPGPASGADRWPANESSTSRTWPTGCLSGAAIRTARLVDLGGARTVLAVRAA